MKSRKLIINSVEIPFKTKFSHSSAVREKTETIIIQIESSGLVGLGESCPRSYVTNETIESAIHFISKIQSQVERIYSLDELILFKNILDDEINKNPSAWCAVELAILDLLAKEKNISTEKLLGINSNLNQKKHTAVIGIDTIFTFFIKIFLYKSMGFEDFKIKLSGNFNRDKRVIVLLSFFSKSIRVDANNFFLSTKEAIDYLNPLKKYIWAIEEPLQSRNISELQEIGSVLSLKIILDESFINKSDLNNIKFKPDLFIVNIRISKMGGILRTIDIITLLEKNHFKWILGSHVGEMSLLSRASQLIQKYSSKNLIAIEGGFSTHLLKYDPYFPNLKLKRGAILNTVQFNEKEGFGMKYIALTKKEELK